jgi:hypothetical protein
MTGTREAPKESIYEALLSQVSQQKKTASAFTIYQRKLFSMPGELKLYTSVFISQ